MARSSNIRYLYSSTVAVTRLGSGGGPGLDFGAVDFTWVDVSDVLDSRLGIPGRLKCRLDLQFVRPGLNAVSPAEAGAPIPRAGTMFCDIPPGQNRLRAGDHLEVVKGVYTGSLFEITAIPEIAQDVIGAVHLEAQIVERGIDTDVLPSAGDILR